MSSCHFHQPPCLRRRGLGYSPADGADWLARAATAGHGAVDFQQRDDFDVSVALLRHQLLHAATSSAGDDGGGDLDRQDGADAIGVRRSGGGVGGGGAVQSRGLAEVTGAACALVPDNVSESCDALEAAVDAGLTKAKNRNACCNALRALAGATLSAKGASEMIRCEGHATLMAAASDARGGVEIAVACAAVLAHLAAIGPVAAVPVGEAGGAAAVCAIASRHLDDVSVQRLCCVAAGYLAR